MAAHYSLPTGRRFTGGTKKTMMCIVCEAIYEPSSSHELLMQAPSIALESALMSISHFCFRCRRPSCPDCWDDVHGVCAACVQEMQLPFRTPLSPLNGSLMLSRREDQQIRENAILAPLICVLPGRFHHLSPASAGRAADTYMMSNEAWRENASKQRSGETIEEVNKQQTRVATIQKTVVRSPAMPGSSSKQESSVPDIDEIETRPEGGKQKKRGGRTEHVLTVMLLVILLVMVVLIVTASISSEANTLIASTLHVDIRAEIAYLWQLITHLH